MSILVNETKESKASLYRSSAFLSGMCTIHFILRSTCFTLPAYLKRDLGHVQKRALSIIYPSYNDALDAAGIPAMQQYKEPMSRSMQLPY